MNIWRIVDVKTRKLDCCLQSLPDVYPASKNIQKGDIKWGIWMVIQKQK